MCASLSGNSAIHQRLRFGHQLLEVVIAEEAFGVDLVDVLSARRTRGEPTVLGHDFQTANGLIVARCMAEDALDLLACQLGRGDLFRRQLAQQCLLLRVGLGVDTYRERLAKFVGQRAVGLA